MPNFITSTFLEYPDNYSIATIVYFSGCDRNCIGCHNTTLKEYSPLPDDISNMIKSYCERLNTNKVVLCGGDPLYTKNLQKTKEIISTLTDFDVCIYTGFSVEEAKKTGINGFKFIKCGFFDQTKFIGSKKTDDFLQFATSNQKLFDSNFKLLSNNGIYYFKKEDKNDESRNS